MKLILEDLNRWFKEKWTAQDGSKCGSYKGKGRVKCRPSKRVSGKTPQTWGEMDKKEKKKAVRLKQKAHKKGDQFSSHKTGKTWSAKKGKYKASLKEQINYSGPHLEAEWEEAQRYPQFKNKNEKDWLKTGSAGRIANFSELGHVSNHDSDLSNLEPEKIARVKAEIEKGEINYPVIGRKSDGTHELVGGNTRVAVLRSMGHDPKVWVFDMPHDEVKEEWNPKNKKKHAACKAKIKSKVKVWPSAYASGLLVQCYKKRSKKKNVSESFRKPPMMPNQVPDIDDKKAIVNYLKGALKNPMRFYYLLLMVGQPASEAQKTMYNLKFPMMRTSNIKTRKRMMNLLTHLIDIMVTDPILYARLRSLAMKGQLEGINVHEEMGAMSVGGGDIAGGVAPQVTPEGNIEQPGVPPNNKNRKHILKMIRRMRGIK